MSHWFLKHTLIPKRSPFLPRSFYLIYTIKVAAFMLLVAAIGTLLPFLVESTGCRGRFS